MQNINWHTLLSELKPYKKEIITAQIIALLAVIISLPIPLLFPYLIDEVLLHQPGVLVASIDTFFQIKEEYLYILVVLSVTLFLRLLFFLLNLYQVKLFTTISKNLIFAIRERILNHLKIVSVSEYEALGSGGVSAKLVTDINTLDQFLGISIGKFIISVLSLIGIAIVLLMIDVQLGLIILVVNPLVISLTVFLGKKVRELKRKENHYIDNINADALSIKKSATAYEWKSHGAQQLSSLFFFFGLEVLRALSMIMVLLSDLSIGDMVAVLGYIWFMFNPVQEILLILFSYANATTAMERLNKLLTLKTEPHYEMIKDPFKEKKTNSITLKNLSFSYLEQEVIHNLSLHMQKGKTTAILGKSGSGKTTLAHIILGLYTPQKGEIFIDDIPNTQIGVGLIRQNVALVLQHPRMFNDTLRANLTLGENFCDELLWKILEDVQLEDVAKNLTNGLETMIGKDGIRLSGGERQRLSLARMLLRDPNIIILDESTSALDVHTEANLFESLQRFLKGKTVIIIAHRLSTIKHADYIYMIDNGKLIEEGTPTQLLDQESRYSRFVHKNLEG